MNRLELLSLIGELRHQGVRVGRRMVAAMSEPTADNTDYIEAMDKLDDLQRAVIHGLPKVEASPLPWPPKKVTLNEQRLAVLDAKPAWTIDEAKMRAAAESLAALDVFATKWKRCESGDAMYGLVSRLLEMVGAFPDQRK